jgi:hypothetical protein
MFTATSVVSGMPRPCVRATRPNPAITGASAARPTAAPTGSAGEAKNPIAPNTAGRDEPRAEHDADPGAQHGQPLVGGLQHGDEDDASAVNRMMPTVSNMRSNM